MPNFLRKIRKSLLDSGSAQKLASPASRYFLYALGEIALVVIGILIALQINNWSQNQSDKALAQKYLQRLKNDLKKDTSVFHGIINDHQLKRALIKEVITKLNIGIESLEQVIEIAVVYDQGLKGQIPTFKWSALDEVFVSHLG